MTNARCCRHEDGVLLSIDQMSPSQFDQVKIVISCDQVGEFEVEAKFAGVTAASAKVPYSDLVSSLVLSEWLWC